MHLSASWPLVWLLREGGMPVAQIEESIVARIAHLTSVHSRDDTRIFHKMCVGLAKAGHEVILIVADGQGNEERQGVRILDVGKATARSVRVAKSAYAVYRRALSLKADLYHLHDPELLIAGVSLRLSRLRVIFDSHEDFPLQIMSKSYLPAASRRLISFAVTIFERFACRCLSAVVTATPTIRDKFIASRIPALDIRNYPLLSEMENPESTHGKAKEICYVGGLFATRGVGEIVAALPLCQTAPRLNLAGNFVEPAFEAAVRAAPGWSRVNELGFLSRTGVRDVLGRSMVGLVTLYPMPAYKDALPVKMFEYMSAGLPVVASDFPLWREIVEGNDCGICVDPLDPAAIAAAIDRLIGDPDLAGRMANNGRRAVEERYNWAIEEKRLHSLYAKLLTEA